MRREYLVDKQSLRAPDERKKSHKVLVQISVRHRI